MSHEVVLESFYLETMAETYYELSRKYIMPPITELIYSKSLPNKTEIANEYNKTLIGLKGYFGEKLIEFSKKVNTGCHVKPFFHNFFPLLILNSTFFWSPNIFKKIRDF